jgi:uncharacterized protein YqeY
MSLQETIKKDLPIAMKAKDDDRKDAIRVILGEFSRSGKKELSDDEVIGILKKLIKSENELLKQKGETTSNFIAVVEGYLPRMVSPEEVLAWIKENVDFSQYKNKMQAMGPIMKHFGAAADGNTVKKILQESL